MNDIQTKLLEQASDILTGVSNTVSKASNLAADQLPEIATQYIAYGMAWYTAIFILLSVGTAAIWIFTIKYSEDLDDAVVPLGFIGLAGIGFSVLALKTAMMVWFAPKVWLIKEIVDLVK